MRHWYRITNKADESVAEIHIYGDIGVSWWDDNAVSAQQFIDELKALPESVRNIRVHINSAGGDVFEGIAIANALRDQRVKGRSVETIVDGLAASIASVVAQAGSPITMADNALMCVHDPWALAIGNARDMRKMAEDLDTIRDVIVATYKWNSPLDAAEIAELMAHETWMDATQAIENGLATQKAEGLKAAASLDSRLLPKLKIPDQYKARVDALLPQPKPEAEQEKPRAAAATDVLALCQEAGLDLAFAQSLITAHLTTDEVKARVTDERTKRAEAKRRADAITKMCADANLPELAAGYIAGAMTVDAVKAHLTTLTAKLDRVEIDGGLPPDHGTKPTARINTAEIYARRNAYATKH